MTRRDFLWMGGAALAAPAAFGDSACPSTTFRWCTDSAPCPSTGSVALAVPRPFADYPPKDETIYPFKPSCTSQRVRPLWSELKADPDKLKKWSSAIQRGYTEMLRRSSVNPCDPTGLLYQTWLHDYYCNIACRECIHTNWFFLPWHRAFIYFHERILRDACQCEIDFPEFCLPVWDWETENGAALPQVYADLGLPSFFTGNYKRLMDYKDSKLGLGDCALQGWLLSNRFEDFCGTQNTNLGSFFGPHNTVHVGLVGGAMGQPSTAAGDPLFYAHHANVDRFWSYWQRNYAGLVKQFQESSNWAAWKNQSYFFHDETRKLREVKVGDLLDECGLGYKYSRDPNVGIYEFESLTAQSLSSPGLYEKLGMDLAGMIPRNPTSLRHDVKSLGKFLGSAKKTTLPTNLASLMFPMLIKATISDPRLKVGQYYLIELQKKTVGGFGIFSHPHAGSTTYDVAAACCLDASLLNLIQKGGNLEFSYGPVDVTYARPDIRMGEVHALTNVTIEFLPPASAVKAGETYLRLMPHPL
jgi:hypothetical protein